MLGSHQRPGLCDTRAHRAPYPHRKAVPMSESTPEKTTTEKTTEQTTEETTTSEPADSGSDDGK